MKAKKSTSKKVAATPPEIEVLVQQISSADESTLSSLLIKLIPPQSPFTYPRADLHSYIPLLDRFDSILERLIEEYGIDGIQKRDFEDDKRVLVLEILRVERLVLDNTTSRKIFASYDRLQSLLFTSDLSVLHATLLLLLRPAQQYSSHTTFQLSSNHVVKSRLLRLAEGGMSGSWGKAKEEGWGMKELAEFVRTGDVEQMVVDQEVEGDEKTKSGNGKKMGAVGEDWYNVQIGFYKPSARTEKDAQTTTKAGEGDDASKGPNATELEKPTQELRLASGSSSPMPTTTTAEQSTPSQRPSSANTGDDSMNVDSPSPMDTPVRPRAGLQGGIGRARSGLAQSTSMGDVTEPTTPGVYEPQTPGAAVGEGTPMRTPAQGGPVMSNQVNAGTLTTSPFSRCFTNGDGHVTLSVLGSALLPLIKSTNQGPMDVVRELVGHHPELGDPSAREELFELLCKLTVVMALRPINPDEGVEKRQREMRLLLEIRITALATYLHLVSEDTAQNDLFLYDTSIIPQLADLTKPINQTDDYILSAALIALDACLRYKMKASEVLTAVNANVAHGALLAGFGNLIKRLQTEEEVPHELVDAEIAFVSYAATAAGYVVMLVGAGILPLLTEFFKIRNPKRSGYVARAIGLIDSILYGNANAFNIFVNSGGIDALNARITFEIDRAEDKEASPEGLADTEIIRRTTPLKLSLRSLHRMMGAAGTTEGLRNLIDSELPKSLKRIFENPDKVGTPILAIAINVTATFVHNEPTSLVVLQEMKLPQALYDALEKSTKPSFEVLSATCNAISAMCLNQAGMDLTLSRPQVIKHLVECSANPAYREILKERDNAVFIGGALDELARHHTPLKQLVMDASIAMLNRLIETGETAYSKGITAPGDYKLVLSKEPESEVVDKAEDAPGSTAEAPATLDADASDKMEVEAALVPQVKAKPVIDLKDAEKNFDACVEVACQMLQGLYHNQSLARDFIKADGHKLVLKLLSSPALLAQSSTTETLYGATTVLRVLAEANLATVLHGVVKATKRAMEASKELWQRDGILKDSYFETMLDIQDQSVLDTKNTAFRQIVSLTNVLSILCSLFGSVGYQNSKVATTFLQQLGAAQNSSFLENLGMMHRACAWENVYLKVKHGATDATTDATTTAATSAEMGAAPSAATTDAQASGLPFSTEDASQQTPHAIVENAAGTTNGNSESAESSKPKETVVASEKLVTKSPSPNYSNLRYLASRVPAFLSPFFQGVTKMLYVKRMDPAHKQQAGATAKQLSKVMLKHLQRLPEGDVGVSHAYETSMMGQVTVMLYDQRSPAGSLQVVLLRTFVHRGGLQYLASNIRTSIQQTDRISSIAEGDRTPSEKQQWIQNFGHLKMTLDLMRTLVMAKPLFESPQTAMMIGRETNKSGPEYFNPEQFLLSIRLALFEVVQDVWEAKWLPEAPLTVIRSSAQAIMAIASPMPAMPAQPQLAPVPQQPIAIPRPQVVAHEPHVETLVEMGFTRHAATFALTRLQNNLPGATEYLLIHAHMIEEPPAAPVAAAPAAQPADPAGLPAVPAELPAGGTGAGEAVPNELPVASANGEAAVVAPPDAAVPDVDGDVEMAGSDSDGAESTPGPATKSTDTQAKTTPPHDPAADKARYVGLCKVIIDTIAARALLLVDSYDSLIFDVYPTFLTSPEGLKLIAESLVTKDLAEDDKRSKQLFSRLRLLAVVAHQADFGKHADSDLQETLMKALMALLPDQSGKTPKWFSAYLLSAEALLIWGEGLVEVVLTDEQSVPKAIRKGPIHAEARRALSNRAMHLLGEDGLESEDLFAGLRLLVLLTRDGDIAASLLSEGNLGVLLAAAAKAPKAHLQACQSFVTMIMRHLAEDTATLKAVMGHEIRSWFAKSKTGPVQVPHFVSNIRQTALRDPDTFLHVIEDQCRLVLSERSSPVAGASSYHLQIKTIETADSTEGTGPKETNNANNAMQVDDPFNDVAPLAISAEGQVRVAHFLVGELIAISKADIGNPTPEEAFTRQCRESTTVLILTELLGSYMDCKKAFLSPPKKAGKDGSIPGGKTRSGVLNAIINRIVSNLVFDLDVCRKDGEAPSIAHKRRVNLSNWTTAAIVALCADVTTSNSDKENAQELLQIRKTVMDAIAKALKDVTSSTEPVTIRYGKLWALSQLCHRLLTARPSIQPKTMDESTLHIAKVMLEKSFVPILTAALVEIDLQYPSVKNLVTALLQPLEHLTKLSTRMGKSERAKSLKQSDDIDMTSESDSDDSGDETGSEEAPAAPDMYRNSALGMFGGAVDDYMDNSDDDDGEEEEGGDEFDDDMDDMDEDEDSEGTEPTDDDEEEEDEHDMDQWQDVDVDEEAEDDELDAFQAQEGLPGIGAPGEDGDLLDLAGGDEMPEGLLDEMEDGADDYDDDDMQDEDDYDEDEDDQGSIYNELEMDTGLMGGNVELPTAGATQNWGWAQPAPIRDEDAARGQGTGHRRGHSHRFFDEHADVAMFGRSREDPTASVGIANHPLLQNPAPVAQAQHPLHRLALRGPPAGMPSDLNQLFHTLDQMVGGDAVQLLEDLVSRGALGQNGADRIRIDLEQTPDGRGSIGIQVGRNGPAVTAPLHATSGASSAATETVPQPTASRWLEEEKLVVPVGAAARIAALSNLIVKSLLPEAKRLEEERKRAEDVKRIEKEREAAEAKVKEEQEAREKEVKEQELKAAAEAAKANETGPADDVEMVEGNSGGVGDASSASAEPEAAASPPAHRVMIMIHGEEVDITETGIDPEFLEALPDDMRADVVNQHLRERRGPEAAQGADAGSSEISPEFLDALPPEIRAEVIQQEAIEQARRNQAQQAGAGAIPQAAAAFSQAFLASLEPAEREAVLMQQDAGVLAGLFQGGMDRFANVAARAGGRADIEWGSGAQAGEASSRAAANATSKAVTKKTAPRDAIQLLDKAGVASLTRLLFFPEIFRKNDLLKILANLCENARNRGDLINLLLAVLQEDTGDLNYIERQTLPKDRKPVASALKGTPTPRKKIVPETPSATSTILGNLQSEHVPAFVAQRAFEGLAFIVQSNEQATLYFLTEHDTPVVAKKAVSRKGKGKERPTTQMAFPIVVLLSLLARPLVLDTPAMIESLMALLATVTRPLTQIAYVSPVGQEEKKPIISSIDAVVAPITSSESPLNTAAAVPERALPGPSISASAGASADGVAKPDDSTSVSPPLLSVAPKIPSEVLQLVANVLTYGECTSRTFSHTLVLIRHLSHITEAKEAICAELRSQAQSIGDLLVHDLKDLGQTLRDLPAEASADSVSMAKFTAASSDQAKLLRLLKTIDYMFSPKSSSSTGGWDAAAIAAVADGTTSLSAEEDVVNGIFETFHFNPVWDALGECLGLVQDRTDLVSVMTVLLPLVESLMVVSKYSSAKVLAAGQAAAGGLTMSPMSPKENVSDDTFFRFTSSHRKVLNIMVRNNPALMSGSFSLLVLNSRVLEFDNKRNWFTQQLRKKPSREVGGTIHLTVRRSNVFGDSYRALQRKTGDGMKYGKLSVKFHEEEGVDAGGVTREWYSILAREIFNPNYGLFEPCAADQLTYQASQHSWVDESHLSYFKFVGKIIGKAIYDGRLLDAYFSRAFYKQILGRKVDIRDLESVDPEYHKSLVWMLDNDITGIIDLDFSLEAEEFGEKKIIDLKPGGSAIAVTESNKEEYVRLVCEHRLESAIDNQVKAFLEGFYDIIPRKLISIFDPDQLELLISGVSNIDVDELKNATQLHGWKNSDAEISWFWRALRSFSQEERARFLMFVTSSSRVPLGGFSQLQGSSGVQPFQIHKLYREDVLPSSATCFNELLLPSYPSYDSLRARLLTAITEGSGHFGLA